MNWFDFVIIGLLILGFILGYKDGMVRKFIGVVGFILAAYLAIKFAAAGGRIVEDTLGIEYYLAELVAGAVIFLVVILITAIIKRVVHPFDKVNNVINQILGGIVGTGQMLLFMSALLLMLNIFNFPSGKLKKDSYLHEKVVRVIPSTINYVKSYTPETKKVIKDYINDKDNDTTK